MDKELAESIGTATRRARKAMQLTQQDAADRIGLSAEFFARIERGHALPSVQTLAKIAAELDVSADDLLGRAGSPQAAKAWRAAGPVDDVPEVRRLTRRLRAASRGVLRIVNLLVTELERKPPDD